MKIGFFEVRPGQEEFFKSKLPQDELIFSKDPINSENFSGYPDLEVISTHAASQITSQVINGLLNLKLIATRTTGFDHIDLAVAAQKNIPVCNVPSYGESTVAEFAFALLLSLSRKIPEASDRVKQTKKFNTEGLTGFDLKGKTLGVLGTGHIGAHLIQIAKGFEMNVIAFDAFPNEALSAKLGFKYLGIDDVLSESDIISIHVPYLPTTHHLLNSQNMIKIKKGAVLINTARGAVVETESLLKALEDGTLSAAGLDVLEEEDYLKGDLQITPKIQQILDLNFKLMAMPNVLITPHNAFNSNEALQRILDETLSNIEGFKSGTPKNLVKPKTP